MKRFLSRFLLLSALVCCLPGCKSAAKNEPLPAAQAGNVSIEQVQYRADDPQAFYWFVQIDLTVATNRETGRNYARALAALFPGFNRDLDLYLREARLYTAMHGPRSKTPLTKRELRRRVADISSAVPPAYQELLDGMTDVFADSRHFSARERIYAYNLIPDIFRGSNCSALAVLPAAAEDGKLVAGRVLDWSGGVKFDGTYGFADVLSRYQAVTRLKTKKGATLYLFGALGNLAGVTAVNADTKIMGAILDASYGDDSYASSGKRSYAFDLVQALEDYASLPEIAACLLDAGKAYAFNHLILLADPESAVIVENNLVTGKKNTAAFRAVRFADSGLQPFIPRLPDGVIAAVNAFMLAGQSDNFTDAGKAAESPQQNTRRYGQLQVSLAASLAAKPDGLLGEEDVLAALTATGGGRPAGGLKTVYNKLTQQILVYIPAENRVRVFMRPADGSLPSDPQPYFFDFPLVK